MWGKAVGEGTDKGGKRREKRRMTWGTLIYMRRVFLDNFQECKCLEKTLEKPGLEPIAPGCLAKLKHCALSTQQNPHPDAAGDLADLIKRNASDRPGN